MYLQVWYPGAGDFAWALHKPKVDPAPLAPTERKLRRWDLSCISLLANLLIKELVSSRVTCWRLDSLNATETHHSNYKGSEALATLTFYNVNKKFQHWGAVHILHHPNLWFSEPRLPHPSTPLCYPSSAFTQTSSFQLRTCKSNKNTFQWTEKRLLGLCFVLALHCMTKFT